MQPLFWIPTITCLVADISLCSRFSSWMSNEIIGWYFSGMKTWWILWQESWQGSWHCVLNIIDELQKYIYIYIYLSILGPKFSTSASAGLIFNLLKTTYYSFSPCSKWRLWVRILYALALCSCSCSCFNRGEFLYCTVQGESPRGTHLQSGNSWGCASGIFRHRSVPDAEGIPMVNSRNWQLLDYWTCAHHLA